MGPGEAEAGRSGGEEGARCAQCGSSSIVHETHEGEELMVRGRGRGGGCSARPHCRLAWCRPAYRCAWSAVLVWMTAEATPSSRATPPPGQLTPTEPVLDPGAT